MARYNFFPVAVPRLPTTLWINLLPSRSTAIHIQQSFFLSRYSYAFHQVPLFSLQILRTYVLSGFTKSFYPVIYSQLKAPFKKASDRTQVLSPQGIAPGLVVWALDFYLFVEPYADNHIVYIDSAVAYWRYLCILCNDTWGIGPSSLPAYG